VAAEFHLLERYLHGEGSLEEALTVVETAKETVRSLRAVMEPRGVASSENHPSPGTSHGDTHLWRRGQLDERRAS
jgi:hypothetical protein